MSISSLLSSSFEKKYGKLFQSEPLPITYLSKPSGPKSNLEWTLKAMAFYKTNHIICRQGQIKDQR